MPVTKQQKTESLAELVKSFEGAKTVVFTQYQGTRVKEMRELRKKLTGAKVGLKVARKTLMSIAAKQVGFSEVPASFLEGPIALAFGMGDEIAAAKIIHEFAKTHETIKIVGAIFEGKLLSAAEAKVIAMLPGREALLGQLVGLLKSPIAGFHGVLHGLLRNFVYTLSEIQKKMPALAEASPAMPVAEAPAAVDLQPAAPAA